MRLDDTERAAIAWAILRTLSCEQLAKVIDAVFPNAGMPIPLIGGGMGEARHWASQANPGERKAYAWACYEAMDGEDRSAFLAHVSGRVAA